MHSVRVSSQLLVSVLFIAVPTNTENFKFYYTCQKLDWDNRLCILKLLWTFYDKQYLRFWGKLGWRFEFGAAITWLHCQVESSEDWTSHNITINVLCKIAKLVVSVSGQQILVWGSGHTVPQWLTQYLCNILSITYNTLHKLIAMRTKHTHIAILR